MSDEDDDTAETEGSGSAEKPEGASAASPESVGSALTSRNQAVPSGATRQSTRPMSLRPTARAMAAVDARSARLTSGFSGAS